VERLFFILNGQPKPNGSTCPHSITRSGVVPRDRQQLPSGMDFADEGKEIRIDPADNYIANPRSSVVLLAH
jgi:hypothetical protein